ncbi:MAG TPA: bifunctional alpha,alpha-trehalose-phosphate synthase (UDP-forming)/trehalose-phosphatase [bacterium]|nr:bifunctional alpha,alpha-trehalose-phosphate synthase (UDP-forming)/trehalose-phosphatase [bacterium]
MISARATDIKALLDGRPLVVVSNREPYEHRHSGRGIMVHRPASGLAAALDPVLQAVGGTWVAWGSGDADFEVADHAGHVQVPPQARAYTLRRVRLPDAEVRGYYYGYANQALWPLCHMATQHVRFELSHWETYVAANRRFADATLAEVSPEAIVWVHDYHLALCPRYVRQEKPDLFVMSFWHIPWPQWEVWQVCPQRGALLDGLLANDLVGLQHPLDVHHFLECAERELGAQVDREESIVEYNGHFTHVQAFPISVDAAALERTARSPACEEWMARLHDQFALEGRLIAVGVDRLDYTKGIPERLHALEVLFQSAPAYRERLVFIQKTAPSRTEIKSYRDLQQRVEGEIARINAAHGTPRWRPIIHLTEAMPQEGLAALYRMADACIVSSLADGMNLVAKEFVACQVDQQGVLVLSELAGAWDELPWAISINPHDAKGFAARIQRALELEPEDRRVRMKHLRTYVADHDIFRWMTEHLQYARHLLASRGASHSVLESAAQIRSRISGRPLALLVDFDGTLTPIVSSPDRAILSVRMRETLSDLAGRPDTLVAVISGRSLEDIRHQVGLPELIYAGNHGLEIAWRDSLWMLPEAEAARADVAEVCRRLRVRLRRVAGVIVEDKGLTASIHFRQTPPPSLEEVRVAVLEEAERAPHVVVRPGKQVWELWPNVAWNKGAAAQTILGRAFGPEWASRVAVVYLGDDRSDEDAFMALPEPAVTVKVGSPTSLTAARYLAGNVDDVAQFLELLAA